LKTERKYIKITVSVKYIFKAGVCSAKEKAVLQIGQFCAYYVPFDSLQL